MARLSPPRERKNCHFGTYSGARVLAQLHGNKDKPFLIGQAFPRREVFRSKGRRGLIYNLPGQMQYAVRMGKRAKGNNRQNRKSVFLSKFARLLPDT